MEKVAVIMGSKSDFSIMEDSLKILREFNVNYECLIVSAHRTPEFMVEFSKNLEKNGFDIVIAGAGGAAHLPGMVASLTALPVIGVPVKGKSLEGLDSLLSIVQMPGGVPVATMAINNSKNGGLMAIRILGVKNLNLREKLKRYMEEIKENVLENNGVESWKNM
ncbi:5-(carboxyamino)imidazole ribonucleotide mutase [Cetobacterium ceti]|uniref:N5-carboxyaminoimidazole ribonucleotide mutase n=1 Tax=Cetobacterium ceti TaxID=180163 RepID=A0A1T4KEK3_9FUSO|nr:5-(carboxyamino)imidazole ribonucleotide mutase [Cetobacterium ceti]SJZ40830.1 5-(carboxyamino)imidazole ribonucleotide mutase [Cetobacterium ceti]